MSIATALPIMLFGWFLSVAVGIYLTGDRYHPKKWDTDQGIAAFLISLVWALVIAVSLIILHGPKQS